MSVDITNEQIAIDLLKEMIGMWITIRGFSIAKAWLEKYMPEKKSKQKALRKELKSISTPSVTVIIYSKMNDVTSKFNTLQNKIIHS